MLKNVLLVVNLLLLIGLATYVFTRPASIKQGYILNQKVFGDFKGTQQLEKKLKALKEQHQRQLDSLATLAKHNKTLLPVYQETGRQYALEEQQLSDQYTVDLWKDINGHVSEFGKTRGYSFIFGATGNGTIMFANEIQDITAEVTAYINQKYEGE